jgi:hypothetical protein
MGGCTVASGFGIHFGEGEVAAPILDVDVLCQGWRVRGSVKFNDRDNEILQKTTTDLIDVAQRAGGTYDLPYQLFYPREQLRKCYPEIDDFFAVKKKYDPSGLFSNKFYEKYGMSVALRPVRIGNVAQQKRARSPAPPLLQSDFCPLNLVSHPIHKRPQLPRPRWMSQLTQRLGLNLPDTFPSDCE